MEHISVGDKIRVINGRHNGRTGIVIDWMQPEMTQVILVHLCYDLGGHVLCTADQLEVI